MSALEDAANNYAIGSALIGKIKDNPEDAASYPAIDTVGINLDEYDVIIIGAPLWWNQMAAPLQTYLFHNGSKMSGKKVGLIVSSWSSGYTGVESDAKRLIPHGDFLTPTLWLNHSDMSDFKSKITEWLQEIEYSNLTSGIEHADNDDAAISLNGRQLYINGDFKSLSVFRVDGSRVMSSEDGFDACNLAPGCYIASISTDAGHVSRKIIIQ